MRRGAAALLTLLIAGGARAAEERAVYRAAGQDARLFDQYDNDGYSLSVTPAADGSLELAVRVSDSPLVSGAGFRRQTPETPPSLPRPIATSLRGAW